MFSLIDSNSSINLLKLHKSIPASGSSNIVIFALYNESGQLLETQVNVYNGKAIPLTTNEEYDSYKVFVWNNLTDIKPVAVQ